MTEIILGYPYSGALYAYFADQQQPDFSHTKSIGNHPYYTTLYGRNHAQYAERALMLTLLYDKVHLTPADNPWPKSNLTSDMAHNPELGLYADWNSYAPLFNNTDGIISQYLEDAEIMRLLGSVFKIPEINWKMVLSSILYEYSLSRKYGCAIICSSGRKLILERLVEVDRPALHHSTFPEAKIEAIDVYSELSGLLLAPSSLDDLINIKPDKEIRTYASSFLGMISDFQTTPSDDVRRRMIQLLRDAIEIDSISKKSIGLMGWAGSLLRILGLPHLAIITTAGSKIGQYTADQAKWHALAGEVQRVKSKSLLVRLLDEQKELIEKKL